MGKLSPREAPQISKSDSLIEKCHLRVSADHIHFSSAFLSAMGQETETAAAIEGTGLFY